MSTMGSSRSDDKTATAAAMIFPLVMAWAYLVALSEKLQESFYANVSSSSSNGTTSALARKAYAANTENIGKHHRRKTSGDSVDDKEEFDARRDQHQLGDGHYQREQEKRNSQRGRKKQLPNRLEFSLGDFLRSKLHCESFPGCSRSSADDSFTPAPRSVTHAPSYTTNTVSGDAFDSGSSRSGRTPSESFDGGRQQQIIARSGSSSLSSWPFRKRSIRSANKRLSGQQQQQQQQQQEHQRVQRQVQQKHLDGLPLSRRARRSDKTLVLDLDETLIHARRHLSGNNSGFDFMVILPQRRRRKEQANIISSSSSSPRQQHDGDSIASKTRKTGRAEPPEEANERIFVRKRPHLREFLEAVSQEFEVVLFTAARAEFANAVLAEIDPARELVDHVLAREDCTRLSSEGEGLGGRRKRSSVVKDLGIIGRPLSKVIMVDNSLNAIRYHLENGVHIPSFYGDREDTELRSTLESIAPLATASDVRDGIIRIYVRDQARKEGHTLPPNDLT